MAWACTSLSPNSLNESLARFAGVPRRPDQRDDLVEMVEGDLQALEDVRARLGLSQLELGASADDVAPELDEVLEDVEQRQRSAAARR